ncbi:MAG: hypothetical protein CL833_05000 [Crocinitomicaceae bacterium]|nr:hypothetical protein [Crocinitomicaceae bacterium]|tara:strand:+ start:5263 stop:5613 length:351 start_codon:yes stop_codon:yes gene_type:complete
MLIVNLKLYFVAFDETDLRFKVYLDEQGLTPTIQLNAEDEIDDCIFEKTLDFFYGDTRSLMDSCKLSRIEKENNEISIVYNIYCYEDLNCKSGKFVSFDKNSIELYRFAQNRGKYG